MAHLIDKAMSEDNSPILMLLDMVQKLQKRVDDLESKMLPLQVVDTFGPNTNYEDIDLGISNTYNNHVK